MATRINLDRNATRLARNKCCQCDYEWQDQPFGLAQYHSCPKCGFAYWVWLNYDDED